MIFGMTLPVVLGLAAFAFDGVSMNHQSAHMQSASDAAALGVAKELLLFSPKIPGAPLTDPGGLVAAGKAMVEGELEAARLSQRPHTTDVSVDFKTSSVTVTVTMAPRALISSALWAQGPVKVTSVARSYGNAKLCILGLNRAAPRTVSVKTAALITAPECAIQSNSDDSDGLVVSLAAIVSSGTCSSGGIVGISLIVPKAETDCPALDDPLADRPPPTSTGCDFLDFQVDAGQTTLSPGVYCGGIKLDNKAVVDLNPGVYVITGGKLDLGNKTQLRGENVSFYFADDAATFDFRDNGVVDLSAPKDGPMAGILFYADRKNGEQHFKISSDSARKLLGTIYLPNAVLEIGGLGKIADASAYTVIVVNKLEVTTATLVVNADYAASDVPVPPGLGPTSGALVLEK